MSPDARHDRADLDALLVQTKQEQREAQRFGWPSAIVKTAGGAVAGFVGGSAAWGASLYTTAMDVVKRKKIDIEQFARTHERASAAEQQKMAQKLGEEIGEDMIRAMRSGDTLAATVARNPVTVITGATLLAGGAMLALHVKGGKEAQQKVDREAAALERLSQSWQERVEKKDEPEAACSPCQG